MKDVCLLVSRAFASISKSFSYGHLRLVVAQKPEFLGMSFYFRGILNKTLHGISEEIPVLHFTVQYLDVNMKMEMDMHIDIDIGMDMGVVNDIKKWA